MPVTEDGRTVPTHLKHLVKDGHSGNLPLYSDLSLRKHSLQPPTSLKHVVVTSRYELFQRYYPHLRSQNVKVLSTEMLIYCVNDGRPLTYLSGWFWFLADLIGEFFGVVFMASCPATSLIKMIHQIFPQLLALLYIQ